MKILMINISIRPNSKVIYIPLGFAYIATAVKRHGYDMEILDIDVNRYGEEYVREYLNRNKFDVVCMGCIVTGYKYVKQLSALIKEVNPKVKIIAGNSVASSIPDILLSNTLVDIAVIGEGDTTIAEVLDALASSRSLKGIAGISYKEGVSIIKNAPRGPIENIDTIPFPEWELFDMDKYIESCSAYGASDPLPLPRNEIRAFPISTSRGCPFRCTFCYHVFRGLKYRYISPGILAKEIGRIKRKYKINYFIFHDDLTLVSKEHAQEIVDNFLSERLNVYWVASCRSDLFQSESDIDLARSLKDAGCVGLVYSLENASQEILKMMNKKIIPELFTRQSRILEEAGLARWTSLVFGYPQETPETIRQTFDFCIENRIYPSAGYLLPQPGSEIYDYAVEKGFIKDEEDFLMQMGDRQDLRINMTAMSNEEFQRHVVEGLKRCNEKLHLGLQESQLVKTQYYRAGK